MTFWFRTDANPFGPQAAETIDIDRYILQESGQPPTEYVDQRTGEALLPAFGFVDRLLPRADTSTGTAPFESGTYLGQSLRLRSGLEPEDASPPSEIRRLVLRSDLIIGTSRNFRDDGKGRKDRKSNYTYIPFTKADYDEMIAAGINYFTARDEQVGWICHRPVFYDGHTSDIAFPEELYRPNFLGCACSSTSRPAAWRVSTLRMRHWHRRCR